MTASGYYRIRGEIQMHSVKRARWGRYACQDWCQVFVTVTVPSRDLVRYFLFFL